MATRIARRHCSHARIPCGFSECSFSELVLLRESILNTRYTSIRPLGTTPAARPLSRVAWACEHAGDRPARRPARKTPTNTLIANNLPEFPQPRIEWHPQRTFGEHGDLRPKAMAARLARTSFEVQACANYVWYLPNARFRMLVSE
jgi:hypothetical protein